MEEHRKKATSKQTTPGAKLAAAKKQTIPWERLKKEQMTSVIWTTPLGLPIVQPYRKTIRKQIMTNLQTVFISDPNINAEGNSLRTLWYEVADMVS